MFDVDRVSLRLNVKSVDEDSKSKRQGASRISEKMTVVKKWWISCSVAKGRGSNGYVRKASFWCRSITLLNMKLNRGSVIDFINSRVDKLNSSDFATEKLTKLNKGTFFARGSSDAEIEAVLNKVCAEMSKTRGVLEFFAQENKKG